MDYMREYEKWLASPALTPEEHAELESIRGDEKEIRERFYGPLEFGTAGLRGTMKAGLHQMNVHVIRWATQGFANIIAAEGEQTGLEGCLSIPGKFGIVTRPYTVRVRAQDRDGNFFEVEDEELTARCFCHEIEHLDGHLFVEHTDHLMTEEELEEYMNRQEEDEE